MPAAAKSRKAKDTRNDSLYLVLKSDNGQLREISKQVRPGNSEEIFDINTRDSRSESTAGPSGSRRNTSRHPNPCGECSAAKTRCQPLPSDPTLCARCKSKNLLRCPPHVPWKIRKARSERSFSSERFESQTSTPQSPSRPEQGVPTPPPQPQHVTYYTEPYSMDAEDQVHGQIDGASSLHAVSSCVAFLPADNPVGIVGTWEATYPQSEPLWYPSLSHVATAEQAETPSFDFQSAMYYMQNEGKFFS